MQATAESQALQALVHALVDRDGTASVRELMPDVATLALRPPTTDPSPDAWHSGDVAFGFGASRLVDELLAVIETRTAERAAAAAMAKATKQTRTP